MMSKAKYIYKRNELKFSRLKEVRNKLTVKFIKLCCGIVTVMKKIPISRKAFYELRHKLSSRPAESGGVLLGPANSDAITHFYFDSGGVCTGNSYSPDYNFLNRKLRQQWRPAGLEIKGIAHSHGSNLNILTYGDMRYIKRLMSRNHGMRMFVAPVVLPYQKSIHPMIISRDSMDYVQRCSFELF
jgi:hypothetical protein